MGAQYYIGTFSDDQFTPEQHGRMNWPGGTFFAAEQLRDQKGRNIIWGWVIQPHNATFFAKLNANITLRNYGWAGVMSLPRVVSLGADGTLQIAPAEELKGIRLEETTEGSAVFQPNEERPLQARGKSIELDLEIDGGIRSPFGVKVFASPDGREETVIRYEPDREELVIDFSRSTAGGPVSILTFNASNYRPSEALGGQLLSNLTSKSTEQRAPLKLRSGESLKLNIFVDRSVIEVFANGRQAMTQVVYPKFESSTEVRVFSGDEPLTLKRAQSWKMAQTNAY